MLTPIADQLALQLAAAGGDLARDEARAAGDAPDQYGISWQCAEPVTGSSGHAGAQREDARRSRPDHPVR